ncbi:5961_t:CDS:2, partial [Racocetra persica]
DFILERRDERIRDGKLKGQITKITIKNCPKVKELNLNNNEISEIILEGEFLNLERLESHDNKLKEIDISKAPNLTFLSVARNPINNIKGLGVWGMKGCYQKRLDELKNRPTTDYSGPLKEILGLNPADNLPVNWQDQLAKKDDLAAAQSDLKDPAEVENENKKAVNDLQKELDGRFPDKTPQEVANELNDLRDKPTGSTLTAEQEKKLNDYEIMAAYLDENLGGE